MEADWVLPQKKQSPLYLSYSPHSINLSQDFVNPFLGYPTCPIIGRYNRGEYRIGQTLFQLEFKCIYNYQKRCYECGGRPLDLPELMHENLRSIPQAIANNKAAGIKNSPQVLPEAYPVRQDLSILWIVSFGELGKDFLNYLNHMYVLAPYLFAEQKLKRQIHYLPIYAYLPQLSGLNDFQVERGLNYRNYRGQYMSFHLAKGAPAFSPNNMRLSILGGKIVTSKQPQKQEKKQREKKKFIGKQQYEERKAQQQEEVAPIVNKGKEREVVEKDPAVKTGREEEFIPDFGELQKQIPAQHPEIQYKKGQQMPEQKPSREERKNKNNKGNNNIPKEPKLQHQGFIHFYTSVLLQKDYRVYYHWHIEDRFKEELIKQVWSQSRSVEEFLSKYVSFGGKDPMALQASRLLHIKEGQ